MIELKSFAKINLGLEITGKRPDGYHNLKTIFQTINLYDTIRLQPNNTGQIQLRGNDPAIEWNEKNTIYRAFAAIYKKYNLDTGFDVEVEKKIPAGSGLGGGSSNAAVILLFLNRYFNLQLDLDQLISIAVKIGADVPFFLVGGTALGEGVGEKITPLENLEKKHLTIIIPPIHVSTQLIFSHLVLTKTPITSKIDTFVTSRDCQNLDNQLEKVTFELFPQVGVVKERMKALQYEAVMMSGSGCAVFGCGTARELAELQQEFPGSKVFMTETITREEYINCAGASPSGKASVFGADTRRFESSRPSSF